MIRAVIIDDERNSQELTANLLHLYCKEVEVLATGNSVENGFKVITEHKPELVFLDVEMQDGTGFDLLKLFTRIDFKVIFITAHQAFAIDAFKFSAVDYLLKPLSPPALIAATQKAGQAINSNDLDIRYKTLLENVASPGAARKKIVLKTIDKIYSVNTSDIIRFESEGSYTKVFLNDGKKIMVSRLIKEFDDLLCHAGFARIHQSHLINMDYLFCYEKTENHVVMKDNSQIPVSARKKEHLLNLINSL